MSLFLDIWFDFYTKGKKEVKNKCGTKGQNSLYFMSTSNYVLMISMFLANLAGFERMVN